MSKRGRCAPVVVNVDGSDDDASCATGSATSSSVVVTSSRRVEGAATARQGKPQAPASLSSLLASRPLDGTVRRTLENARPLVDGWISHGALPSAAGAAAAALPDLSAADAAAIAVLGGPANAALAPLLRVKPDVRGRIQMYGKLIDTPRFHQAYLKDYVFTGVRHTALPVLPPPMDALLRWANAMRGHWVPTADGHAPAKPVVPTPATTVDGDASADDGVGEPPRSEPPTFNAALVNWYLDGNDYMGAHADDEREMVPLCPIFCLSVGQTRVFRIRRASDNAIVRDVPIRSGEYVVMGGAMQRHYKHEVVPVQGKKGKALGARVSITFRQFR